MADVITRFKLETSQYDSALRDASKSLAAYSKQAELASKDFDKVTQSQVEAARAFGGIQTSATNAKDKVKELVAAYNDVAKAYNKLTDEQKNSDFGKAMAQSLQQLQGRIRDAKQEMGANGGGGLMGALDGLTSKFGISTKALGVWGAALATGKAALDVAKDAFNASEVVMDEWGRITASSQSTYEGFLNAINNGDISGYLSNIDQIVKAAREAYDELDKLGTMKTIQAPQISRQEAENNRMRMMIMTGRYIAPADGRTSTPGLKSGDLLSKEQIRTLERQLQGGMNTIVKLTKNEIDQTGRAIDAYYKKLATQSGMSLSEFRQGTSSWAEFSSKMRGYEQYRQWEAKAQTEFARQGGRGHMNFDSSNPYYEYKKWGNFRIDKMGENSYNDLVGLIRSQQQQTNQLYSTMGQAYRTVNRAEGITVRGLMGGPGGGGRGGGRTDQVSDPTSIAAQEKKVQELTKAWREASAAERDYIKAQLEMAKGELAVMNGSQKPIGGIATGQAVGVGGADTIGKVIEFDIKNIKTPLQELEDELKRLIELQSLFGGVSEEAWAAYQEQIDITQKKISKFKGKDSAKETEKSWNEAAQAISSVGSALQQIEDPSLKIAGIVGQAIAQIALGFAQATASDSKLGVVGWLAAIAGGMGTMLSTISAIHNATGYAQGGIVEGSSYSGDNIPIMANAGELILSKSQQSNLVSSFQNSGSRSVQVHGIIHGEDIILSANRTFKRKGQGEIVTW
jgi:hypothetical protein